MEQIKSFKILVKSVIFFPAYFIIRLFRYIFPNELKIEKITLSFRALENTTPLVIVHLSDFHYDTTPGAYQRIDHNLLETVILNTNKIKPDLILLTGDYVQRRVEPIIQFTENYISRLKSKYGIYACLGNHDYKEGMEGRDFVIKTLESHHVKVLHNSTCSPISNFPIQLFGVGDFLHSDFNPEKAFTSLNSPENRNKINIILSHNPDSAEIISKKWNFNLMLSGHTHGGQICLPKLGPVLPIVKRFCEMLPRWLYRRIPGRKHFGIKNWIWYSGLHVVKRDIDGDGGLSWIYTNRGLATHPPMRLFCAPELTIFTLNGET